MSYTYLGKRGPITGVADTTGFNSGNWTIAFTPAILNVNVPEYFIYKIQVAGQLGATFNINIENVEWDVNIFGTQNSWHDEKDDSLVVRKGENVYILYSNPVGDNTPPVATIFLRYDSDKWAGIYG